MAYLRMASETPFNKYKLSNTAKQTNNRLKKKDSVFFELIKVAIATLLSRNPKIDTNGEAIPWINHEVWLYTSHSSSVGSHVVLIAVDVLLTFCNIFEYLFFL